VSVREKWQPRIKKSNPCPPSGCETSTTTQTLTNHSQYSQIDGSVSTLSEPLLSVTSVVARVTVLRLPGSPDPLSLVDCLEVGGVEGANPFQ